MSQIESEIMSMIKEMKQLEDLDPKDLLIDEGIVDSFDIMNLVNQMNDQFSINIDGEDLTPENLASVETMTKLVERLKG